MERLQTQESLAVLSFSLISRYDRMGISVALNLNAVGPTLPDP